MRGEIALIILSFWGGNAWKIAIRNYKATLLGIGLASCSPMSNVNAAIGPLGNLDAALQAISINPESLTCNLDNQNSDGTSCQQLDNVVRWRAGRLLTIRQDWGGSASTGAAVWNGANVATWFLENRIGPEAVRGKSFIELGAGVGFTSLVADALGASEVAITDGNEDVLGLANKNIATNVQPRAGSNIYTARLRWNTDDETSLLKSASGRPWDYVFASDVTYMRKNWPDLIACICHLLSQGAGSQAVLSMEPRNIGEVEGVLGEAVKAGLQWREEVLPGDHAKELCSPFCARVFVLSKPAQTQD